MVWEGLKDFARYVGHPTALAGDLNDIASVEEIKSLVADNNHN